jgi:hypothetical protein
MDYATDNELVHEDEGLDALLELQAIEGQEDDPLLQMFSTGSCLGASCS